MATGTQAVSLALWLLLIVLPGEGCPPARPLRHFQLQSILGGWHVVQFYSSGEEGSQPYRCMRANLSLSASAPPRLQMIFSYVYADDPKRETLLGNLTWDIPEQGNPAHWVHTEDPYDGIYDTYVLDADPSSWALLLHCARNPKRNVNEEEMIRIQHSPLHNVVGTGYGGWRGQVRARRFLSAFILSRQRNLSPGPLAFLRDKLPTYGVDLEYVSNVEQKGCRSGGKNQGDTMAYQVVYEESPEERRVREERRKTREEEDKEDREMEEEDEREEEEGKPAEVVDPADRIDNDDDGDDEP
ncbi:uncharacterized protein LOC124163931 [Ischnura elegans]|uniref:uncharacterized protein LOC124163931 n=1 Tax=Ischnura elegans TaxID=197161 RepID=UPI001ED89B19|nr:uncharacterized protein LOC124163931 [Ischnura elegans]